jgi:hypothetical protein
MSARNISRDARVQQLRAAYQEAFDEWAFAITRLQFLSRSCAGGGPLLEAQNRVAEAYQAYRETRDLLAANLVSGRRADSHRANVVPFKTATSAFHP